MYLLFFKFLNKIGFWEQREQNIDLFRLLSQTLEYQKKTRPTVVRLLWLLNAYLRSQVKKRVKRFNATIENVSEE